jgi:hypothetical protein
MGLGQSLAGIFTGDSIRDENRRGIRAQQQGMRDAQAIGDEFYGGQIDAYGQDAVTYGDDLARYREAQTRDLPQMGQFNSDLNVEKFLDPYQDYVQEQEAKAIEQSAAARGGMFSGGGATAKALQDRSQQIAGQFRDRATNLAKEERQFGYNDFLNRFKQERENDALEMQGYGNLLKQSGGARENMFGAQGGQANLGMQTEQGLGQLEQQVYQNNANFIKGMSDNVGSAIDEGVELGANIYSGGMTGMASTLGGGGDAPKGVSNPYNKDYSMFGANKALS